MGIEPLGAIERAPSLVEYREWRLPTCDEFVDDPSGKAIESAIAEEKEQSRLAEVALNESSGTNG